MNSIFKNSYIILVITFVFVSIICYIFQFGYNTNVDKDGRITKSFSWKYPLAISLIVWVVWHYYLYPPAEEVIEPPAQSATQECAIIRPYMAKTNEINFQKINLMNWR
jgi:hypothetical protein